MGVCLESSAVSHFQLPASLRFVSRYIDFLLMFLDYGARIFLLEEWELSLSLA